MAKDILSEIVSHKRQEIASRKRLCSEEEMEKRALNSSLPSHSMKQSLLSSSSGIIAEFKRRSPSKGWIKEGAHPEEISSMYALAGASAISVLADEKYFGAQSDDISCVRKTVSLPILRKEFIVDAYQIHEARVLGADAILLIAACLTPTEVESFAKEAHRMGLEVLLELHGTDELSYVTPGIDMVGINNRNLGTFVTNVDHSYQMAAMLCERVKKLQLSPSQEPVLVSESGISDAQVINQLRGRGFRGFLIGETFMKTPMPGETLRAMINEIYHLQHASL